MTSERLVDLASWARSLVGCRSTERVDLDRLCDQLGIEVKQGPLQGLHGTLTTRGETIIARINDKDSPVKRRFTLAHEVAHFLYESRDGVLANASHQRGGVLQDRSLEQACDALAAEILMPAVGFAALIRGRRPSIDLITELAEHFEVSVESCALRFGQLTDLNCQISKWSFADACFTCVWERGPLRIVERGATIAVDSKVLGLSDAFESQNLVFHEDALTRKGKFVRACAESKGFGPRKWRYVLCALTADFPADSSSRRSTQW